MRYKSPITCHHKITQEYWGNSLPPNIVMLRENVHRAVHTIFGSQTPIQVIRSTLEMWASTLHPDVYAVLSNTLSRFEWAMEIKAYDPRLFNSDTFLKAQKKHGK